MLDVLRDKKYIGDRPIYRVRFCGRRLNDIEFNTRTDEIRLRLQPAPRSVVGDQGIDPIHIIILAKDLIEGLNELVFCTENEVTIELLNQAIEFQKKRQEDRISRKVEGTSKP